MSTSKFLGFSDAWCFFGFFTSILFFLSPVIQIVLLFLGRRLIDHLSFLPILCMFANCALWFLSSLTLLLRNDPTASVDPLDYCNLVGGCFCLIWGVIIIYKKNSNRIHFLISIILFFGVTVGVLVSEYYMIYSDSTKKTCEIIVRWVASTCNVLMYFSPGLNVLKLIKEKDFNYIAIECMYIGIVNALIWLIWAARSDNVGGLLNSIIANSLGIILIIGQIVLYHIYRKNQENKYAKEKDLNLVQTKELEREEEKKIEEESQKKKVEETNQPLPEIFNDL